MAVVDRRSPARACAAASCRRHGFCALAVALLRGLARRACRPRAQSTSSPSRSGRARQRGPRRREGAQPQMLVQANEIQYDIRTSACSPSATSRSTTTAPPRSRQGHLRPEDQAAARRRQCPAHRGRRQDHLRRDHRSHRRLPRRLRRFAPARGSRPDALRRHARRPHRRQLHGVPKRRLHRLRGLQGRPEEAAALAGQGRPHHPRRGREDDLFRAGAARILRHAARLFAVSSRRPTRR